MAHKRRLVYVEPATLAVLSKRGAVWDADVPPESPRLELVRRVYLLIRDQVMRKAGGKLRSDGSIVARLLVLQALLDPSQAARALAEEARGRGLHRKRLGQWAREYRQVIAPRVRANGSTFESRESAAG